LRQVSRNVIRLPFGNRNGHHNYNMKIILIGADLCARLCFLSQPFRVINIIEHMFCLLTKLLRLPAKKRPPFTLSLTGALLAPIQTFLSFSPVYWRACSVSLMGEPTVRLQLPITRSAFGYEVRTSAPVAVIVTLSSMRTPPLPGK